MPFTPKVSTEELGKELPFQKSLHNNLQIPHFSRQTSNQKESSCYCQKARKKYSQKSFGVEIVENPVMGQTQRRRAGPRSRRRRRRWQQETWTFVGLL